MNDQWGNRRPGGADTGIAQVLEIYATRGGRLEGARRWPQNPLTLTHVRWMSEYGEAVEAFCPPEDGASIAEDERSVWVDLAVEFSAMHPNPAGMGANWAPLPIGQERAVELSQRITLRGPSGARSSYASGADYSGAATFGPPRPDGYNPFSGPTSGLPGLGPGQVSPSRPLRPSGVTPPPYPASAAASRATATNRHATAASAGATSNRTSSARRPPSSPAWRSSSRRPSWVRRWTSIPALSPMTWRATSIMRSTPFHRRGRRAAGCAPGGSCWRRGSRWARGHAPGQLEMDAAIQMLREALTRYTLTYSAIGHADLGAWSQQGQPLPE